MTRPIDEIITDMTATLERLKAARGGEPVTREPVAWLAEDHQTCPSWCDGFHQTGDAYEDRIHQGRMIAVPLTADELAYDEDPGMARPGAEGLPHINMCLVQHYREEWPRIWLGKGGSSNGFRLTLAEAEWLATELRGLAEDDAAARRAREEGRS